MKKIFNWMLAAILICGASVFTSCSNDDDKNEEGILTDKHGTIEVIPCWKWLLEI